ncbi:SagB family peptide dehydrogenase [Actinopolymorpha sp. B9G3]|uniref:SagB family peptide dehydrogenase n=1 Tax=Actinopolymorpha sp. B9G3 TaxID=3158970 RepID=UPI0032D95FD2
MSGNEDIAKAWAFHDATKYSVREEAEGPAFAMGTPPQLENAIWEEDRSLEPYPYKIYSSLAPIPLPREFPRSDVPALDALARVGTETQAGTDQPDLATLARIALFSCGVLDRRTTLRGGRIIDYRAAGGTGARYHLEAYFVCGDLPDLPAGLYHYAAHDHSLRRLRSGDFRGVLVDATGGEPALASAPVVLALTSTFWRNAWRYKARAYRHAYWDAGTTLSHVRGLAASCGLPATLVLGYVDREVNDLLGVDGVREATVALCAIGRDGRRPPAGHPEMAPLDLPTRAISGREVEFPLIPRTHAASRLDSAAEVERWRAAALRRTPAEPRGRLVPLEPLSPGQLAGAPVEDVIARRRSTRHFDVEAELPFVAFSTLLDRSTRGIAADCLAPGAPALHDCYLIVHGVEGLAPGVYVHHPGRGDHGAGAVELLRQGDFRQEARRLAVGQWYTADAHVNAYYLTDLHDVLGAYGNRGYRLSQLESALRAGIVHLGTHALGALEHGGEVVRLGAVGSTSCDDEVVEFFSPHAAGMSYMFVTVFGRRRPSRR